MSDVSDFYGKIRSVLGDNGIDDALGNMLDNSYYYSDAVIAMAIDVALLDTEAFTLSGSTITPDVTAKTDIMFITYSSAMGLLLSEAEVGFKVGDFSISKNKLDNQLTYFSSKIMKSLNDGGTIGYITEDTIKSLYNKTSRYAEQIENILD